jgi:hypothetical protein
MFNPISSSQQNVKPISGKELTYQLRHMSARGRLSLALDFVADRVKLHNPTIRQACTLTGTSLRQLNEARALAAGCSLRELRQRERADHLVARVGVDRVMAALDRATRAAVAAE